MKLLCIAISILIFGLASYGWAGEDPPLLADDLFDADTLVEVDIRMDPDDWDALRFQTRSFVHALRQEPAESPFTYFPAAVTINGVEIEGVGVRKKGFLGSLDDQRPSLKIHLSKFRKGWPIEGLDRLTLNNNKQDRSLGSQVMGYQFFNDVGVHAPRCNLAHVTLNGESLGIYTHVESVREPMLDDRFGDGAGDLFEGTLADFYPGLTKRFEPKGDDVDDAPLEAIAALLDHDTVDVAALSEYIDIDAFIRFWAAESLLGFWDGYVQNQNNFYLYRSPTDDRFRFIPWGVDCAFETRMPISPFEITFKSMHHRARLANRLSENEAIRAQYRRVLEDMLTEHWDEDALLKEVDRIEALVEDHLHATQSDLASGQNRLRAFIRERRSVIEGELADWPLDLDPPNRPDYFVESGSAQVSFTTVWSDTLPMNPFMHGTIDDITLIVDDERVELRSLGVSACPNPDPNAPNDDRPTLLIFGRRASDNMQIIIGCSLRPEWFAPGTTQTGIDGFFLEGETVGANARPKFSGGVVDITFDEAGLTAGDTVRGHMAMQILRFSGSLFGGEDDDAELFEPGTLWAAAWSGDVDAITTLLDNGADMTESDGAFGMPPLTIATIYGHADAVELLLQRGAPADGTSRDGGTALHAAAFLGRARCAALLLEHGADIDARNFRGESASDSMLAPWQTVAFIANVLKYDVEEDAVMAGRTQIAELFEAHESDR